MRLFILGSTGRTGIELIDLALERGHEVTAFARSPQKIVRRHDRLVVAEGDPHVADEIARRLPGHDAILSTLGPRPRAAMSRTTLLGECADSTIAAMRKTGVRRLAIVSSALLFPGGGPLFAIARLLIRPHVRDLRAMEERVVSSELDFTIARPPRLVRGGDAGYRAEPGRLPSGTPILSWRALAGFLLEAVEHQRYLGQLVGVTRAER